MKNLITLILCISLSACMFKSRLTSSKDMAEDEVLYFGRIFYPSEPGDEFLKNGKIKDEPWLPAKLVTMHHLNGQIEFCFEAASTKEIKCSVELETFWLEPRDYQSARRNRFERHKNIFSFVAKKQDMALKYINIDTLTKKYKFEFKDHISEAKFKAKGDYDAVYLGDFLTLVDDYDRDIPGISIFSTCSNFGEAARVMKLDSDLPPDAKYGVNCINLGTVIKTKSGRPYSLFQKPDLLNGVRTYFGPVWTAYARQCKGDKVFITGVTDQYHQKDKKAKVSKSCDIQYTYVNNSKTKEGALKQLEELKSQVIGKGFQVKDGEI